MLSWTYVLPVANYLSHMALLNQTESSFFSVLTKRRFSALESQHVAIHSDSSNSVVCEFRCQVSLLGSFWSIEHATWHFLAFKDGSLYRAPSDQKPRKFQLWSRIIIRKKFGGELISKSLESINRGHLLLTETGKKRMRNREREKNPTLKNNGKLISIAKVFSPLTCSISLSLSLSLSVFLFYFLSFWKWLEHFSNCQRGG